MKGFFRSQGRKASPSTESSESGGARGTVLIVDDSPTETRVFRNVLTKAGYNVETAVNGEEGVEAARRILPDVVLMDVVMPVLNGFQATRILHQDPETSNIPVIIVSTKDQATDRNWGMRQGASEYLVKPVSPEDLLERIEHVLKG